MLRRDIYYRIKPFLPWSLRVAARRLEARSRRRSSRSHWPIHPESIRPPEGWAGWPEGKQFAFVLTHDVEGPDGLARCRRLAELERSLGFRSSFNLIPEGPYQVRPELCQWLKSEGFEVGIHDLHHDGKLYTSGRAFRKNAERINRYVREWGAVGFRSAFMLHELDWLHQLDIEYDASTFDTDPFEPQPDGAGTIFPFWVTPPSDSSNRRGYLELPYTLPQDSTLFLILQEETPEIWLRKLDWVAQNGGMALVNVHPDYLRFPDEPTGPKTFPIRHYVTLLKHVRDNYAGRYWHPLPCELARKVAPSRPRHHLRPPRRACVVTYSFYETDSRVFRYCETLTKNGDSVDVLCIRRSPGTPREQWIRGVRVIRLQDRAINEKSPAAYFWRLTRFLLKAWWWIFREHKRARYSLLHFHNVPDFLVFAGWLPKATGAKIILDVHDIMPELFQSKFKARAWSFTVRALRVMEKASAAFADHIILANDLWREPYTRRSAPPEKVSVMINYVDDRVFAPRPRRPEDGRKIVIFPGSLQTHQGLDVAIRAFPQVVAAVPAAELHIYGEGPAKPALMALAQQLELGEHVKFFGLRPIEEIAAIMAEADLGVVPKRADLFGNEAFSTKILEFMSLGVPVVASSTKIDRFYFNDSVLRFFASGNSADLAGQITDLLTHPEEARALAARGSEHAARNTWQSRQGEYLALVNRLCPRAEDQPVPAPQPPPHLAPCDSTVSSPSA